MKNSTKMESTIFKKPFAPACPVFSGVFSGKPVPTQVSGWNLKLFLPLLLHIAGLLLSTFSLAQVCSLSLSVTTTNSNCGAATGSAIAVATGGTSPYTYEWTNGDTTDTAGSLSAGIYVVTVTDTSGCIASEYVLISDEDFPLIFTINITNVSCYGGSDGAISIAVSGGTPPYTYFWDNGIAAPDKSNLSAGTHEIQVMDANGCQNYSSYTVSQPLPISLLMSTINSSCGNPDGAAMVSASGGLSPYTYSWSNGATTDTASNIAAGGYFVTVTDVGGCFNTANTTIFNFGSPTATIDSIITAGCSSGTGSIYISVSGGVTPYTFLWSNGDTTEDLVGVFPGNYGLTIHGGTNPCEGGFSATIPAQLPAAPAICIVTIDSITRKNLCVFEKDSIANLGILRYNFYRETTTAGVYQAIGSKLAGVLSEWADQSANPLQRAWRYKITAVDTCGNESPLSNLHKTIHLSANIGLNNTVNLLWDNYEGISYFTFYIWRYEPLGGWVLYDSISANDHSYTDTLPLQTNLKYSVEVNHPTGCTASKTKNYNSSKSNTSSVNLSGALTATATTTNATFGNCDGSATLTANGGTPPYTYSWSTTPVQVTATATGLCTATYTVVAIDASGDSVTVSVNVGTLPGIGENSPDKNLKVFPNPSEGIFNLIFNMPTGGNFVMKIYNMQGQMIFASNENSIAGIVEKQIDLSAYPPGIYQLQIITDRSRVQNRVMIR